MDIIMLIVAVLAILWAVASGVGQVVPPDSGRIVGLLGVAAFGFVLGFVLEQSNAGLGAWLGFVATIAIAWGALFGSARPATTPERTTAPPPSTPAV